MEKNHTILLGAGIVICAVLFFINIYLGAIGIIILIALAMSVYIMEDAEVLPDISVFLLDDAKGITVTNRGTAPAYRVHVALVPLNIEFDISELAVDARSEHPLQEMVNEAKASVTFEDSRGSHYTRAFALSALGKNDDDLLKPMFPMFKWK
ncbi:MAG: hypothetical protein STSR0009_23760 [Methanoregula sp.]|nr:hypothetical protein [Methanoregula sp.]